MAKPEKQNDYDTRNVIKRKIDSNVFALHFFILRYSNQGLWSNLCFCQVIGTATSNFLNFLKSVAGENKLAILEIPQLLKRSHLFSNGRTFTFFLNMSQVSRRILFESRSRRLKMHWLSKK